MSKENNLIYEAYVTEVMDSPLPKKVASILCALGVLTGIGCKSIYKIPGVHPPGTYEMPDRKEDDWRRIPLDTFFTDNPATEEEIHQIKTDIGKMLLDNGYDYVPQEGWGEWTKQWFEKRRPSV